MSDGFRPNPVAVERIQRHLLGEDLRNVKVAIESGQPPGWILVPPPDPVEMPGTEPWTCHLHQVYDCWRCRPRIDSEWLDREYPKATLSGGGEATGHESGRDDDGA